MLASALLAWLSVGSVVAENRSMLRLTHTIAMPEVTGRFGQFLFDPKGNRLFVTETDDGVVEIIDFLRYASARRLTGFHAPREMLLADRFKWFFITEAGSGMCAILDSNTFAPVRRISLGKHAGTLRFDPRGKVAYVGFADGAIAVIDVITHDTLGTVRLDAAPAAFEREHEGARMFVNVPALNQVAVVDQERRIVTARWDLELARGNRTMALDEPGRRLFLGMTDPPQIRILDTSSGASVASVECASDPGDLQYDAVRKRLFVAAGGGFLDVLEVLSPTEYRRTARIPTAAGARTALLIPERDQLIIGVPRHGQQPAEIRVYHIQS
jgi:DNA-binding beta-propeller fold protein YncE